MEAPAVKVVGTTLLPGIGTPLARSVFQDAVRVNEDFGNVVDWDLISRSSIAGLHLIPASNPLAGALARRGLGARHPARAR
jgi:iron complex outermembrane receptor protein